MALHISNAQSLMQEALNYRATRQDMIASNIANVTTPNYTPRDIDFESMLAEKKEALFSDKSTKLTMATTSTGHLLPKEDHTSTQAMLFFRDGHMARNDGNSVDLDVETTELAKNSQMFNAIIAAMKKDVKIYSSVIEASAKV